MFKFALPLTLVTIFFTFNGFAATWENGVKGDWDSNHWGLNGRYPGELEGAESAVIYGAGSKVKLKSNIPNSVGELWVHNGGELEIAANASSQMAKIGCYGEPTEITQTSGVLTIASSGFYLGYAPEVRDGCVATYRLSGGKLSVEDPEQWSYIGTRNSGATALMIVSGSGVLNLPVAFITNGTLEISGGSAELGSVRMFDPEPVGSVDSKISVIGTAGSLSMKELKAHGNGQGSATLEYQLDAKGVSPIEVADLALSFEGSEAKFVIDATAWNKSSGLIERNVLVLIKYKKLWGSFNDENVTLKGIKGSLIADYSLRDGMKAIVLEVDRKP